VARHRLETGEKPLHWIGSAKRDLLALPAPVVSTLGYALGLAQYGGMHPSAKTWKGEGPGVFELVEDDQGNTYRAVYTVRFARAIYVLHAFQKKSPQGIVAARRGDDCAPPQGGAGRLSAALWRGRNVRMAKVTRGTGDVFTDLGFRDAPERRTKLKLAKAINEALSERGLTQAAAAAVLGVNQPKVSALTHYRLDGFSVERLLGFLTALGRDIDIVVKRRTRARGRIAVLAA